MESDNNDISYAEAREGLDAHTCREFDGCTCSLYFIEPCEKCPTHGDGVWPPRCYVCGRFMKRKGD